MLVVTAEIWPGGERALAFPIGRIIASNVSDLAAHSHYEVTFIQPPAPHIGVDSWTDEFVTSVLHARKDGVWALVRMIIEEAERRSSDPSRCE
jgi:hypothetical protein